MFDIFTAGACRYKPRRPETEKCLINAHENRTLAHHVMWPAKCVKDSETFR